MPSSSEPMTSDVRYSATKRCLPPNSRTAASGSATRRSQRAASNQRGRPALGARVQQLDFGSADVDPAALDEQLARLGDREGKLIRTELRERSSSAQPPESEQRVDAGDRDHPRIRREVLERVVERSQRLPPGHGLQLVEHETRRVRP